MDWIALVLHCIALCCIALRCIGDILDWIGLRANRYTSLSKISSNSIQSNTNAIQSNAMQSNQIKSIQIKSKSYLVIYQSLGGSSFVQYLSRNWVGSTSSVSSYTIWALVTLVSTHSASFISPIQSNHANIPSHPSITLFVMKWSYTYTLYSSQCNIHQCLTRVELTANFLAT